MSEPSVRAGSSSGSNRESPGPDRDPERGDPGTTGTTGEGAGTRVDDLRRVVVLAAGAACGAALLGAVAAGVGYLGVVARPGPNLAWGVAFVLSFVAALFGMIAPLSVFFFLASRQPTRVRRQLYRAAGVGSLFVVYPVGAAVGGLLLDAGGLTVGSPLNVLVVLDAVGGTAIGGIVGFSLAERWLDRPPE